MISRLRGTLISVSGNAACIDVNGIGYEVHCSAALLAILAPAKVVTVVAHTDVREDAIKLYGFADELEKQVFLLLLKVSGVGAKTASDIVSAVDKTDLLRIIGCGDLTKLQKIKGIGKKTSERIIVELRDRVGELVGISGQSGMKIEVSRTPTLEAIEALVALGFARAAAEKAVGEVGAQHEDPGAIVREALRYV